MGAGRPRKISSPEEFERRAAEYFESCHEEESRVLMTGLANALGLTSVQALYSYEHYEGYEEIVQWAKLQVQQCYEGALFSKFSQGPQFGLRAFFGMNDRKDIRLSGDPDNPVEVNHKLNIKSAIRELIIDEATADEEDGDV